VDMLKKERLKLPCASGTLPRALSPTESMGLAEVSARDGWDLWVVLEGH